MLAYLQKTLLGASNQSLYNFKIGFLAGVIVFFLLAILTRLIIFFFISNKNRCDGISISSLKGKIFVSASAISDLVRIAASSFGEIKIEKIALKKNNETLYLDIAISIISGKDPISGVIEMLQAKILDTLNDRLSVNSLRSVNVKVQKIVSSIE